MTDRGRSQAPVDLPRSRPPNLPDPSHFDPKAFRNLRAGVLGMGRSGLHAANILARKGFQVLVSDTRPARELQATRRKLHPRAKWEGGGHSDRLLRCGFVVKSPGIAPHAPILERLRKAGVPVFSELEVALGFCPTPYLIAITGTNGKTTTALLTEAIFRAARKRPHLLGNIGTPVSAAIPKLRKTDLVVLEVSSYQLEDSHHFHPTGAALLNVTADHVDHHGTMSRYIAAKARIFRDQSPQDTCVFNAADPIVVKLSRHCPARKLFFSAQRSALSHAWVSAGRIHIRLGARKRETLLRPPSLPGIHNLENAMAAALLAISQGVLATAIQRAFGRFREVEHRIEPCGTVSGIECVNDSKATNVESTVTALRALSNGRSRILLILGGLHKGYPYAPIRPYLGSPVKGILTIGSAARKIEEDLSGYVPIFPCDTLQTAVRTAFQVGQSGDLLLLSPACASFDQFRDFEERGQRFKELILQARRQGRLRF